MATRIDKQRLVEKEYSKSPFAVTVVVDTYTGVEYMKAVTVNGISLVPLIDKDGKPLLDTELGKD